jgi:Flp pilus assembly protein protease CpaA
MSAFWLYTVLIGVAGYTDWRWRMVPNALSWIAIGYVWAMIGTHVWTWSHVWWPLGIWILFELWSLIIPGGMGYGDFKVAAWTLAFWPVWGLWLVLGGSVWTIFYGTLVWWPQRHTRKWTHMTAPWAVGVTLMWLLVLSSQH